MAALFTWAPAGEAHVDVQKLCIKNVKLGYKGTLHDLQEDRILGLLTKDQYKEQKGTLQDLLRVLIIQCHTIHG